MTETTAKPKPARSAWPIVGFALIGLLVLSLIVGGVGVSAYNSENPKVAQPRYSNSNTYRPVGPLVQTPQAPTGSEANAATTADIQLFLTRFGKALPTKNLDANPWIDFGAVRNDGRTLTNIQTPARGPAVGLQAQIDDSSPDFETENQAIAQVWRSIRRTWRTWNWAEMIVSRVNTVSGNEWHAYTQFPQPDGSRIKIRWTLSYIPRNGSLAITHWMDLKTGWESNHEMAVTMASHTYSNPLHRRLAALRGIPDAHESMDAGKIEDARKALDRVARSQPVDWGNRLYGLAEARYGMFDFDDDEAIDRIEARFDQNTTDLPALALLIHSLRFANEAERLSELVRRYQSIAGPDADVLAAAGVAAVAANQSEEGRDYFEQSLKVHPENAAALVGLLRLTPEADKPGYVERIARGKVFPKLFPKLAEGFWVEEWKSLEQLGQWHRKQTGDETAARFVVRAQLHREKYDEAQRTFRTAADKLTGEARAELLRDFLSVNQAKNRPREAYDAVAKRDQREAFRSIVGVWEFGIEDYSTNPMPEQQKVREENRARFNKLLDDHARNQPDDPMVLVYRALSQNIKGDFKAAETNAAAFLDKFPVTGQFDEDFKTRAQLAKRHWLIAKLRQNQVAQAVERFPDADSFQTLAYECVRAELPEPLNTLLRIRSEQTPTPPDTAYWRGEFHRLKKEPRRAAQEFLAYLNNRETGEFAPQEYQARDQLVRCWLKTGNADDTLEFLKSEKEPQLLLTALALSAKSPEEAEAYLLDAIPKSPWLAAQIYRDPDLGPILKSPDFARLRKKHPEPTAADPDE